MKIFYYSMINFIDAALHEGWIKKTIQIKNNIHEFDVSYLVKKLLESGKRNKILEYVAFEQFII